MTKDKSFVFEKAMEELETIVNTLESESESLEKSMELFENGVKLSKSLIKKYKISPKNILGHSDIAVLRKKDPGEKFPWKYLFKNKIGIWHTLNKRDLIKNRKLETSKIEENIFFNNLFKVGYSKKYPKGNGENKYSIELAKTFQRRFRQELVDGKIDQECLLISKSLIKTYNKIFLEVL